MGSILTNNGAMVALQTLKSISKNLGGIQDQISTGKKVATAKDNAAVWAISTVMQSDVSSFKSISDSLALGSSTVGVARDATETVTDLLTQMKTKIVAAQEDNVDREKIQADVSALRDQINSVVGAAQFNGLNFLQGTESVDVLASLDRSNNGGVAASSITVGRQDLQTTDSTRGATAEVIGTPTTTAALADGTLAARTDSTDTIQFVSAADLEATDSVELKLTVGNSILTMTYAGAGDEGDVADAFEAAFAAFQADNTDTSQGVVTMALSGAGADGADFDDFTIESDGTDTLTITNPSTTLSLEYDTTVTIDPGSSAAFAGADGTTGPATAGTEALTIAGSPAEGETINLQFDVGGTLTDVSYVISAADVAGADDAANRTLVAASLQQAIDDAGITGVTAANTNGVVTISNATATAITVTEEVVGAQKITVNDSSLAAVSGTTEDSGTFGFTNGTITEGDSYRLTVGSENFDYVARAGDTINDVTTNLAGLVKANSTSDIEVSYSLADDPASGSTSITITNKSTSSALSLSSTFTTGGTVGGGLETLNDIDVSSASKADGSLDLIEGLIQKSIDASAQFGSDQKRIDTQKDFISKLTDGMKAGIGSLVDADMEEASARLQALQVQQQLGTQALSIANQAPQNILSLFR